MPFAKLEDAWLHKKLEQNSMAFGGLTSSLCPCCTSLNSRSSEDPKLFSPPALQISSSSASQHTRWQAHDLQGIFTVVLSLRSDSPTPSLFTPYP